MLTASLRKSVTDLTRRRERSAFSIVTLAIAVASISFLAIPTLIDRAMQGEVRAGRLADVTFAIRPVTLSDDELTQLAAIPNVAAVEARSSVDVRILIGERRARARVIGVRDFGRQAVDVVRLESGSLPADGALLADVQDANVGVYDGRAGDSLRVLAADGTTTQVAIAGRARSLPGGEQVQDDDVVVLYGSTATVAMLGGGTGSNQLALRLDDPSPAAATSTAAAVGQRIAALPGFTGFTNLPGVRDPGDWPGKSDTEQFTKLLGVITVLALLSALVLVANTMSTLVAEQTREIGIMRAIGARRRQVTTIYLRTALVLGAIGAVVGVGLGIALANALAAYFGTKFWAVDVGVGVDLRIALISLLVGLAAPPLAALPAIRRGVRVDLHEALEASGSAEGGHDGLARAAGRARLLPRTVQIGLGNVGRRARRSLATATIVALAVANLLAVMAMAEAATAATRRAWGDHLEDVQISTASGTPFDRRAEEVVVSSPGVVVAQPVLKNTVRLAGREAFVWGVDRQPLFRYRLADGRWFDEQEQAAGEDVAVIERNIAQNVGIAVGDEVTVTTAAGDARLRIIGIATNQQENGTALYVPLTTTRALLGRPDTASSYWIKFDSAAPAVVDHDTRLLEDRLAAIGHDVTSEVRYVAERQEVADNSSLTTSIAVLGFVIVAISMVGLANAITTNVLERTREIGILRGIGARARDIRRIFTTEGLTLALAGWLAGIPLGFALARVLVWLVWVVVDVRLPHVFPPWNIVVALAGTTALALVVLFLPVRRAVRLRPGEALRHT